MTVSIPSYTLEEFTTFGDLLRFLRLWLVLPRDLTQAAALRADGPQE